MKMFQLLCVCLFITKYANGFHNYDTTNIKRNDDDIKRKMFSYFEQSSWTPKSSDIRLKFGSAYNVPVTIIKPPTIERTYRTEINIQQTSHPYLFRIMQMIPIKGQISFQYIYQKLFKLFLALQRFKPLHQPVNTDRIIQILRFVFPELGDKIPKIARYPVGPQMIKHLFEVIFPGLSHQDLDLIFLDAQTTQELVINLVLYLCPNIRDHFLWKDDLPVNNKLSIIFNILFPGINPTAILNGNNLSNSIYIFLDMLFQGKLIPPTSQQPKLEGPEWLNFQNVLHQYNINYQTIPQEVLFYLFSNYKTPEFKVYLIRLKEHLDQESNKMDPHMLIVWTQYLNDLKTHKKTLNDMPPEIMNFIQQHKNPQELIQIVSDLLGFPVDGSKFPLDPEIMDLWKKFILDIMNHKGDTTHLPKQLLDYFNSLYQNPDYKTHLDVIFNGLSIDPDIAVKWNIFFDQLRSGQTSLDQMPTDLTTFLINHQHPEEFLRVILKLKDSKTNTNFLDIDTSPEMMKLWKKYIEDVAANKGNIRNVPPELLKYFYRISSNPAHVEYIKLLFGHDQINPKTLTVWNQFISELKSHRVDLKDMPPEIIQLMIKYKNPDEFFKVVLPENEIDVVPDETVKGQWKDWTLGLQNHSVSIQDTPEELKHFFYQISPSQDYQTTLHQIYSIDPDLLIKWKQFTDDLEQHQKSMFTMPEDLKKYIIEMKTPKEFINLIFKGLDPPLEDPIPTPSGDVISAWGEFLKCLTEDFILKEEVIDRIMFPLQFSKYLRNASNKPNYKHLVNNLYQMDSNVKTDFEDFKTNMLQDYNVTLASLSAKLFYFIDKFENPADMFTSILAAYSSEIQEPLDEEVLSENEVLWNESLYDIFKLHESEILPANKFVIKHLTKNTPLESQIDEVFKLHETNALVLRVEKVWKETKEEIQVHDGLEVLLQSLDKLGKYYGKSEELCEERFRIIEALDRVRNGFAAKSECTVNKLLLQFGQN